MKRNGKIIAGILLVILSLSLYAVTAYENYSGKAILDVIEYGIGETLCYVVSAICYAGAFLTVSRRISRTFAKWIFALVPSALFTLQVFFFNNYLHYLNWGYQMFLDSEYPIRIPYSSYIKYDLQYTLGLGIWRYVLCFALMYVLCAAILIFDSKIGEFGRMDRTKRRNEMMILSSYGFRSPIVSEIMNDYISSPEIKTVLVIPFAGENVVRTGERERDGLVSFGFDKNSIYILDERNRHKLAAMHFDYIYVPGGDPFKLIIELNKLRFLPVIKKMVSQGSVYIGVSAGAMIASPDIDYALLLEDCNYDITEDFTALGLTEENVICHADSYGMPTLAKVRSFIPERHFITVRNDEVVTIE